MRYVWGLVFPGFVERCFTGFDKNEGTRNLAQTPVSTSNSKSIDVRHHVLWEHISKGRFVITM